MDSPPSGPHPFCSFFDELSSLIQTWVDNGQDPQRIISLTSAYLNRPQVVFGNVSILRVLSLDNDSSSAPPSALSPPQEELWLLHTSFDLAFALLAGQVKELAAKVNGSGPPL